MATKTISIDLEAYECLHRARATPRESFSQVIKRAHWTARASTAAALLEALEAAPLLDDHVLAALDEAQRRDAAPGDPWKD